MSNNRGLVETWKAEQIKEHIHTHQNVREYEKNKYGEVFTPHVLIDELYNELPAAVWSNPDLKWLDPACGIGNFFMVAYPRLIEGLHKQIPNKQQRSTHILTKMFYMMDINRENVTSAFEIFGKNANIECDDFLRETPKNVKTDILFDIIVGNPPFQKEIKGERREGGHGKKTLWDKFLLKSIDKLKPSGYLSFITPSGWRKPESALFSVLKEECTLSFLHIYSKKEGARLFHVQQRFDSYVLQKKERSQPLQSSLTKIIDEQGNTQRVNINQWDFIPNAEFELIKKIMGSSVRGRNSSRSSISKKLNVMYSRKLCGTDTITMSKKKTSQFKHPVVHVMNRNGIGLWYSTHRDCFFGIPKVIMGINEKLYCYNDWEGKYGLSQNTFAIPISSKKEGDQYINALTSDRFKRIIEATKWGAFQTDYRMFRQFASNFHTLLL